MKLNRKLTVKKMAMIFITVISMSSLASLQGCAMNATDNINTMVMDDAHKNKRTEINFEAGKIIEMAYFSIETGKEAQIKDQYFPKIMPIMAKYGGKMLGSFQVSKKIEGDISPQSVGVFEWPSLEARDQLINDSDAKKLFPIRDDALSFIKLAYFTVEKDITVTFRGDKTYEFFNAWLTADAKTNLPKYFERSAEAKDRIGQPKFLATFKPLDNDPGGEYILNPQMSGIVEWSNSSDYYELIADSEFKKAAPYLEKSLKRIDMLHTRFNFPK